MSTLILTPMGEVGEGIALTWSKPRVLVDFPEGSKWPTQASYPNVVEAADGRQLVSVLGQGPVDVILLDWELPEGGSRSHNGPPAQARPTLLVEQLRRRCGACRVIAMSGRSESRLESLRAGCDGFVSRNDPPDRLLALLEISRE